MVSPQPSAGQPRLSWITVQIPILLLTLAKELGASYCTEEQIVSCKTAVREGSLERLAGGGECSAKQYVQYTHLCNVNNYVPTTDYCCCAQAQRTLCCRYHYSWNYFRCSEADDTIDTIADESLPQELLLTAILVPTAAALCCVICCVRCLCCRDDEDDVPCGCSKCKFKRPCSGNEKDTTAVEKFTVGRSKRYHDVRTPPKATSIFYDTASLSTPSSKHEDALKGVASLRNGAVPSVPSAPPLDDPALAHLLSATPQPTTLENFNSSIQSNSSGYYLHYLPLQHHGQSSSAPKDCTYQEIRPTSTVLPSTYQVDTRFSSPAPTQTLIGILTNKDGCTLVSAEPTPNIPRDPPPAYEDVKSEIAPHSAEKDAGLS